MIIKAKNFRLNLTSEQALSYDWPSPETPMRQVALN